MNAGRSWRQKHKPDKIHSTCFPHCRSRVGSHFIYIAHPTNKSCTLIDVPASHLLLFLGLAPSSSLSFCIRNDFLSSSFVRRRCLSSFFLSVFNFPNANTVSECTTLSGINQQLKHNKNAHHETTDRMYAFVKSD